MKKVLFLCASYRSGGAEKGFVSLLNILPLNEIEAHVMTIEPEGLFSKQLPKDIIIENAPKELYGYASRFGSDFYKKHFHLWIALRKGFFIIKELLTKRNKQLDGSQYMWQECKKLVPHNKIRYDAVIAFSAGFCCYYAIDKVDAPKKYLWVHNDYTLQKSNPEFDRVYFQKATQVNTISDICVDILKKTFPDLKDKFVMVENASAASLIRKRCLEEPVDFTKEGYDITFCSVGRFHPQKGYDFAMPAAKILKDMGLNFCWYIVGDGDLRGFIEGKIKEYGLENNVKLLGLRENPYPYIYNADIFVMTSRFEGKSIALDEAKILHKPILSTKYPSVYDNIEDGVNGLLVEQEPQSIADGLYRLSNDKELRERFIAHHKANVKSNEDSVREQIMEMINR